MHRKVSLGVPHQLSFSRISKSDYPEAGIASSVQVGLYTSVRVIADANAWLKVVSRHGTAGYLERCLSRDSVFTASSRQTSKDEIALLGDSVLVQVPNRGMECANET